MQKGLKTCQKTNSPSCMEAQRVMRRRTLMLVPIADERGSAESLFSAPLQSCCMSHCCCVSAGVSALLLLYISPSHDVMLKAPPTAAFSCAATVYDPRVSKPVTHSLNIRCFVASLGRRCHPSSETYACSLPLMLTQNNLNTLSCVTSFPVITQEALKVRKCWNVEVGWMH